MNSPHFSKNWLIAVVRDGNVVKREKMTLSFRELKELAKATLTELHNTYPGNKFRLECFNQADAGTKVIFPPTVPFAIRKDSYVGADYVQGTQDRAGAL